MKKIEILKRLIELSEQGKFQEIQVVLKDISHADLMELSDAFKKLAAFTDDAITSSK